MWAIGEGQLYHWLPAEGAELGASYVSLQTGDLDYATTTSVAGSNYCDPSNRMSGPLLPMCLRTTPNHFLKKTLTCTVSIPSSP